MEGLAQKLASIDELETWNQYCTGYDVIAKKEAFELGEPLWIARKSAENTLYVNPDILEELKIQNWIPSDLQKRMIWASVLASAEGSTSKARFKSIKNSLLKKHGRDWWEDVYKRQKPAFAAKERIRRRLSANGSAVNMLILNTHLFGHLAQNEVRLALSMIPKV